MANELKISLSTVSLATLVARIYDSDFAQVGGDIAMAEVVAGQGRYRGSVPAATLGTGEYGVMFYDTAGTPDTLRGTGVLLWDGPGDRELDDEELLRETWQELGLNPAAPKSNTEVALEADFDEAVDTVTTEIRKVGSGVGSVVTKTRTSALP